MQLCSNGRKCNSAPTVISMLAIAATKGLYKVKLLTQNIMSLDPLVAISPIDGRYRSKTKELANYFSEQALIKYRIYVEVEWFIFLLNDIKLTGTKPIGKTDVIKLREIYKYFDTVAANRVKDIEKVTNHDVKAVEYYIKENIKDLAVDKYSEFIHFGCTSEDISNLSIAMMLRDAVKEVVLPLTSGLIQSLYDRAMEYKNVALLALTHGQPASPTTVGKEFINVVERLSRQYKQLQGQTYLGKINGAVGNFNAHLSAYSGVDWLKASEKFVTKLGLTHSKYTTQIEPHDFMAENFHNMIRMNNIVLDFDRDIWTYISRGIFKQKLKKGEIGSSTMPHKVNPIDFENSEGNLGLANCIFEHMAAKLPIARMQRDLTDSTVQRNIGIGYGYTVLAVKATINGLNKLDINKARAKEELDGNWEVLGEAVQTVMRRHLVEGAYEKLKELTRGKRLDKFKYQKFVKSLEIPVKDKNSLLKLTPEKYIGMAVKLVEGYKLEV